VPCRSSKDDGRSYIAINFAIPTLFRSEVGCKSAILAAPFAVDPQPPRRYVPARPSERDSSLAPDKS